MRECTRSHKLNTAVQRRVRAAQKDTAGRMWPAGRSLPTPTLDYGPPVLREQKLMDN